LQRIDEKVGKLIRATTNDMINGMKCIFKSGFYDRKVRNIEKFGEILRG
jgi:hypothetical protein